MNKRIIVIIFTVLFTCVTSAFSLSPTTTFVLQNSDSVLIKGKDNAIIIKLQKTDKLERIHTFLSGLNLQQFTLQTKGTWHVTVQKLNTIRDGSEFLEFVNETMPDFRESIKPIKLTLKFDKMVITKTGVILLLCSDNPLNSCRQELQSSYNLHNYLGLFKKQPLNSITHITIGRFNSSLPVISLKKRREILKYVRRYNKENNKYEIELKPQDFFYVGNKKNNLEQVWFLQNVIGSAA